MSIFNASVGSIIYIVNNRLTCGFICHNRFAEIILVEQLVAIEYMNNNMPLLCVSEDKNHLRYGVELKFTALMKFIIFPKPTHASSQYIQLFLNTISAMIVPTL